MRLTAARTGPAGHGELLPDQRVDQRIERAREHLCEVSARDCVTEQIQRKVELLAHLRVRGKGDPIPARGKRLDNRHRHRSHQIRRQLADGGGDIRLGVAPGQQLLHLPLALAGRSREEFLLILPCEMRGQQSDRRQVDAAGNQEREHRGIRRTTLAAFIRS